MARKLNKNVSNAAFIIVSTLNVRRHLLDLLIFSWQIEQLCNISPSLPFFFAFKCMHRPSVLLCLSYSSFSCVWEEEEDGFSCCMH
jgi:hypothetical protein